MFQLKAKEKPYHVHGLQGFHKCTYQYVGNYRYLWVAKFVASRFISDHPYGMVSVTTDKEPKFIED